MNKTELMRNFLIDNFSKNKNFQIYANTKDSIQLYNSNNQPIEFLLHTKHSAKLSEEIREKYIKNRNKNIFTGNIFYIDKNNFLRNKARVGFSNKGLEQYADKFKRNIVLPQKEELVNRVNSKKGMLVQYYQPETIRLEEAIRIYQYEDVIYNNKHIIENPGNRAHSIVEPITISKKYKFALKEREIKENIDIYLSKDGLKQAILWNAINNK